MPNGNVEEDRAAEGVLDGNAVEGIPDLPAGVGDAAAKVQHAAKGVADEATGVADEATGVAGAPADVAADMYMGCNPVNNHKVRLASRYHSLLYTMS